MDPWLRYLIAFVVFCHGFIYVRIGSVLPAVFWDGQTRLLFEEGVVGVIVSVMLLGFAMAFPLALR
jgi:uncharacterized YccA/Bax inhibitor family protein